MRHRHPKYCLFCGGIVEVDYHDMCDDYGISCDDCGIYYEISLNTEDEWSEWDDDDEETSE